MIRQTKISIGKGFALSQKMGLLFLISTTISIAIFAATTHSGLANAQNKTLLKHTTILFANMINMTVGLTALMVVYQTLPILIRSPPPVGFGGNSSSIAYVQLPYMIVSLIISVASGFVVSKFGNLKPTTIGTIIASVGFFVLFIFHSTEASIATVLVLLAIGLSLMQIGSVNVVLTSTPKQFSGISLGMNLLIYLIGSSVGPVIAGIILQAHQITTNSSDSISTSYPSPESYSMIFLIATLISLSSMVFAILLNRKDSSQGRDLKELEVPR